MPPKKSGRPARPAPASRPLRQRVPGGTTKAAERRVPRPKSSRPAPARGRPTRREPAGEVVLGSVPLASRIVGGLAVLAGSLLAVAVLLPYLNVGDEQVKVGASLGMTLASWIWPLLIISAGISVVLGSYPRLGLAALAAAAAVSVAGLVGELYLVTEAAARGRYEIIAGRRLLTSSIDPLAGWYVGVVALILLVVIGLAIGWVWSRVVMDDSESLDPGRPMLGGLAAVTGVAAVLSLIATLVGIPDQVTVSQQAIGGALRPVETLIPVEGAVGLLERPGLAMVAGLILSALLVLFSIFATTLRPRLAVVGALGAFTAYVLGLAALAFAEAGRSTEVEVSVGGWGMLVVALAYAALTLAAWRWKPPARPVSRGLPMRAASRRALKQGAAGRSRPTDWRG